MNILLVNWMDMANPMAGGAEVHCTEIFRRFVERGDRVTLVSSGFDGGGVEDDYHGIRVIRTGRRETYNFRAPGLVRRLEREDPFDLVIEDINKVPLFTPLYIKKPLLALVPHLFGSTVFREANPVIASYVWLMERPIPMVYRETIFEVISESTANDLVRRGVDPENIEVVHCGMDHGRYTVDPSVGRFDSPTILYVGRIKRYKSVDTVLRAMPTVLRRIPGVRLAVVGSGDNIEDLGRLAAELCLGDSVIFTGFVSEEEKVDWMRRSHVIVNPSPKEGWGLTNIEANACGTPAVASDSDGLRDSVLDGETGLLFPFGDHEALAGRLVRLLTDDELYARLTGRAIEWAATFTWERAARLTMEIADEVAAGKRTGGKRGR
ncbi:MAG: glycosyltransferase family 4 protein [Candidatus Latescibacteria bacterium]|nr:glycosyltransferase family 4 protein [Candidatus Latescibacterota bacterium]